MKSEFLRNKTKRLKRWRIRKKIEENWRISSGLLLSTSEELKTERKMKKRKLSSYRKKILELKELLYEEYLSRTQQ